MIQFNLLPDVKKEYVKARKAKLLITNVAVLSSVISIIIVALFYSFVNIAQKNNIDDLSSDIASHTSDIKDTKDINKILTVQNQLSLLQELHEGKMEYSRIFDYVTFVTPKEAKLSTLNITADAPIIKLSGTADSLATVNKFVDNLKSVRYALASDKDVTVQPFSDIITTESGDNESASFTITLEYDPLIFANTDEVTLSIGDHTFSTEEQDI